MRKSIVAIPIVHLLLYIVIGLNIVVFRQIIVFAYLSFIPGVVLLRLLRLKETSILDTILFSVGLSIAFSMFMGLLLNELYYILGLSQPLSIIPLTVAITVFTLTMFCIESRHDISETWNLGGSLGEELKDVFPLSLLLVILPLLSILGALYVNVPVMLLSYVIIAVLCIMSVASKRRVPANMFPFLIFSISLAIMPQILLASKYIVGSDTPFEYFVFKSTQILGRWSPAVFSGDLLAGLYNSMLSITILPKVYSVLSQTQGEVVFKILYPFIFSTIPLILYRIYEKQTEKLIGLLSTLFFIFTSTAFYSVEALGAERQIVGDLFFLLSIFLLLDKTIPTTKRRLLLIIFGAALAVSHYSLTYLYLAIVAIIFIISRIKPGFDNTLNGTTVLLLFGMTFSWYTFSSNSLLTSLANTIKSTFVELTTGRLGGTGGAATMYSHPEVFTVATWINLAVTITAYLFLILGVLAVVLIPKRTGIHAQYRVMSSTAGIILAVTLIFPNIASVLNFTRFYSITLLFLSPCFVIGGKTLLETIRSAWTKIKRSTKSQRDLKSTQVKGMLLLIAILLSAYFLSQSGFINLVTGGAVHSYSIDFNRMKTSNDLNVQIGFHTVYIPEEDVFSALWLSKYQSAPSTIYADVQSRYVVLTCYGMIPREQIRLLTNATMPEQGAYIYLGQLNVVDGLITTNAQPYNSSEISSMLLNEDAIYSNGNSEIWLSAP